MKKGFTLIELLVVISIIALLSSIVLASLNSARNKARDARRLQDVTSLRTALALYASDNSGAYPNYSAACLGLPTGSKCWNGYAFNAGGSGIGGNTALNSALSPAYISSLPTDPDSSRATGDRYIYFQGTGDIHCNGTDSVTNANWIAWEPSTVSPVSDSLCKPGYYACCSGIGCGPTYFCLLQVN
jgi:prepilin-type N-terminal cleavage/methylation domain-containing protein